MYQEGAAVFGVSGPREIDRELSIGDVVSRTFDLYQRDFSKYVVVFLVIEVILGVFSALVSSVVAVPSEPLNPTPDQLLLWLPGYLGALFTILGLSLAATLVFYPVALGSAVKIASDEIRGQSDNLGNSVRFALSRMVPFWIVSIVVGVIVFFGTLAIVVPGIILGIMFSLVVPVIFIENSGAIDSMGRSRRLVGQRWLKSFALYLVIGIIVLIASLVVNFLTGPLGVTGTLVRSVLSAFYLPLLPIMLTVYYYSNLARIEPPSQPPPFAAPAQQPPSPSPQMGVKYCPACGNQMTLSAKFCANCGARQP